jgi:hypothetical protein
MFTDNYILDFEKQIAEVTHLLNPQMETVALKNTTSLLYSTMDNLIEPINKLTGYLKFTKGAIPVSVKDFGLTSLKQKVRTKDTEGVLKYLRTVINNLQTYREQLAEQGFTDDIIEQFTSAIIPIETENQKQYEIINKRKAIVDNNLEIINNLYTTIIEICNVGKMLYRGKNALKVQNYTFRKLLKKVRNTE